MPLYQRKWHYKKFPKRILYQPGHAKTQFDNQIPSTAENRHYRSAQMLTDPGPADLVIASDSTPIPRVRFLS